MKTQLYKYCVLLTLLAGVLSATAQVTNLGIGPAPGGQSVLYWPVSGTNYVLQTTTNLATPNWVTASNAVTVNAVVVTNSEPAGYFRLLAQTNTTAGMVLIPAGSFLMGNYLFFDTATNDPALIEAQPTNVMVSAFYMDVNLVSFTQWQAVYSYATNHGYQFSSVASGKGTNHPVQTWNWYNCVKWSNARSQQAGLIPCYFTDAGLTQVYTNGQVTVYVNWAANGYRLPTEAEWEKAARGGLSGLRFPWGNSISQSRANYDGHTNIFNYDLGPNGSNPIGLIGGSPYTSPVGSFAANGYGLYDMVGNIYAWCWDWYDPANGTPYGQPTTNNPTGPTGPLTYRVLRGGGFASYAIFLECASRNGSPPNNANHEFGFRCVRGL